MDVGLDTARPDDWTLRLEREAAHDTVEYDVSGTLDELSATAARLRADSLVGWRWMWHRIDPEAMAHRVTIVRDAPPGSG